MRFVVRDRGLGIPAPEHERIFEKFFRLDPNLARGVGGTGLGLYISREIVRRMGGRIRVESEPGRGSTFSFELPLAEKETRKGGPRAASRFKKDSPPCSTRRVEPSST